MLGGRANQHAARGWLELGGAIYLLRGHSVARVFHPPFPSSVAIRISPS